MKDFFKYIVESIQEFVEIYNVKVKETSSISGKAIICLQNYPKETHKIMRYYSNSDEASFILDLLFEKYISDKNHPGLWRFLFK